MPSQEISLHAITLVLYNTLSYDFSEMIFKWIIFASIQQQ